MAGCYVCGKNPDPGVRIDVMFHPGRIGPREFAEVPYRMRGVDLCWEDVQGSEVLRQILASGELEPVVELRGDGCRVECSGHRRGRVRRFWSPFRGHRGVPEVGRCPVCWGPIAVEEEA
jgi:hypothetical protein